ncbi:MAG: hypothetical protein IPN86_21685 [Saprospiraceae bacterium]|nr:hypothetical protein [Saprospiraceae bacterium]
MHKTYDRKLITSVVHFPSLGHVSVIEYDNDNEAVYNDSLTTISKLILDSIVRNHPNFQVLDLQLDSAENSEVDTQLMSVFKLILSNNTISNIKIPPRIADIMLQQDENFYMATLIEGFDRTGINYVGQVVESILLEVITFGLYTKTSYLMLTRVMNLIIDKKSMKIIFFGVTNPVEKSPNNVKMIKKQYNKIIPPTPSKG